MTNAIANFILNLFVFNALLSNKYELYSRTSLTLTLYKTHYIITSLSLISQFRKDKNSYLL